MQPKTQRLVAKKIVSAAYFPVTLAEAKAHVHVDHGDEDALISSLIVAATEYCEKVTERSFCESTYRLTLDRFPCGLVHDYASASINGWDIRLPKANLISLDSIKYDDIDGVEQTLSASVYRVEADETPARVTLAYLGEWPDVRDHSGAVRIVYKAGYATGTELQQQAAVPQAIKQAIKLLVGHWFENREAYVTGTVATKFDLAVEAILDFYKVGDIF